MSYESYGNTSGSIVTNICIKQIMHSFGVYNQSMTIGSGSPLFGSVVRAFDFCPGGVLGSNPASGGSFSVLYISSLRLSCRKSI